MRKEITSKYEAEDLFISEYKQISPVDIQIRQQALLHVRVDLAQAFLCEPKRASHTMMTPHRANRICHVTSIRILIIQHSNIVPLTVRKLCGDSPFVGCWHL